MPFLQFKHLIKTSKLRFNPLLAEHFILMDYPLLTIESTLWLWCFDSYCSFWKCVFMLFQLTQVLFMISLYPCWCWLLPWSVSKINVLEDLTHFVLKYFLFSEVFFCHILIKSLSYSQYKILNYLSNQLNQRVNNKWICCVNYFVE